MIAKDESEIEAAKACISYIKAAKKAKDKDDSCKAKTDGTDCSAETTAAELAKTNAAPC
jgi:hypothetical protein